MEEDENPREEMYHNEEERNKDIKEEILDSGKDNEEAEQENSKENNISNLNKSERKIEEKGNNEIKNITTPESNFKDKEKIISIIKKKIKELKDNYMFYMKYQGLLLKKIIKGLEDLTFEKLGNSVNDSMKYLSFFKTSSDLYSKFAEQIKNSNNIIVSSSEKPKLEDNFLNEIMKNTQNIFYQNLSKFSLGLKQKIISKGPLSKLNEKSNKIEAIKKIELKKYNEIEDKTKKLQKKYMSYEKIFNSYLQEENNDNNNINNSNEVPNLIESPDFVYVIKDLIEEIRNLILQINLYVVNLKDDFLTINSLFVEINALVKESILIYIQESKIFFNADVTGKLEEIENYFKKLDEKPQDNSFKLVTIFKEQKNKEDIFNTLQQYFDLLNSSDKVKKELISDKSVFSIEKFEEIISFFEWLISISPQPTDINIDDLIIKKFEIKRDPGIFSKWKSGMLVFTKQSHLILLDKPDLFNIENIVKVFELAKINFRKKEDAKKPFLFELIDNNKKSFLKFKVNYLLDGINQENFESISNSLEHEIVNK